MPSNKNGNPLAGLGLGRKLYKTGLWGLTIALWCVPADENEKPLIVRTGLAIKEKQERICNSVASIFKK